MSTLGRVMVAPTMCGNERIMISETCQIKAEPVLIKRLKRPVMRPSRNATWSLVDQTIYTHSRLSKRMGVHPLCGVSSISIHSHLLQRHGNRASGITCLLELKPSGTMCPHDQQSAGATSGASSARQLEA